MKHTKRRMKRNTSGQRRKCGVGVELEWSSAPVVIGVTFEGNTRAGLFRSFFLNFCTFAPSEEESCALYGTEEITSEVR